MKMKPFIEGGKPVLGDRSFYNGKYQVIVKQEGDCTILAIRREDRRPIFDWRDVQWIKNQLLGPEVEAVQLFPAESRLVDTSNQYYLYAWPEGCHFQFGFTERLVNESVSLKIPGGGASRQRPFADYVRPLDLRESENKMLDMIRNENLR
jgi:hypothetical protein